MGRMRDKWKKRRQGRQQARKPQEQFYGGSKEQGDRLRARNQAGIDAGSSQEEAGLSGLDAERANAGGMLRNLDQQATAERSNAGNQYNVLAQTAQDLQQTATGQETTYGSGADTAMGDYAAGRGAILGGASELEALGKGAAGRYTSAADAAFKSATERTQRNALGLAAGRGNDSIRTALAAATQANQQAALDQQVVKAQEMNQLLGLEQNAVTGAAGIRTSVAGQDQAAAQIQAGRQQAARLAAANALGLRTDINSADAQLGLATTGQRADLVQADAGLGFTASGTRAEAGSGARGQFLGAEAAQEGTQVGASQQYETDRLARQKGPMFRAGSVLFDPANLFNRDKTQ
jgi:hypothetical protein